MPQRVFVTGANGNIGIRLVRALAQRGDDVVAMARSTDKATAVESAGAKECLVGDIRDIDTLQQGCDGADCVFHLAGGLRGPGRETPERINRDGASNLAEALARLHKPPQRLIFPSTWLVYGDRSDMWVDETFRPNPQTNYARSKLDAERILLDAGELRGFQVSIARLAAVYGPDFPILLLPRIRKGRAWLPGEGRDRMPLVHVDDCVAALLLIQTRGAGGEIYHVAGRDQPTINEFYTQVARRAGGTPARFWSTHIPSYIQQLVARQAERVLSHTSRTPILTPDMLRIFTSSLRLKVDRLEKELEFQWRYPDLESGLADILGGD